MQRRAVEPMLLFAALCAVPGCGERAPARPQDVVLVTIDTLRADHLSLYGYERATSPEIDRWFGDGAVFERAYSTEASTSPSVASILSGRLPQGHRVRLFYQLLPDDVALVPDLLPDEYVSAAFVSNMVLTDDAIGFGDRFDHYDDFVDERESARLVFERQAGRTTDAALEWLRSERDPSRPLFLWVHYIDPHGPYRPPDAWDVAFPKRGRRDVPPERIPAHVRDGGIRDGNHYVERYDAEIAYADHEVGRLLDGYARLTPVDDALVLLTADHGESMMEHEQWFTHGYHVYEEIVRVPLLLRGPGVPSGRFDAPASGIDVATTILRFAGVEPPPAMRGLDLRAPERWPASRAVFVEAGHKGRQWRAATDGRSKAVIAVAGPERELVHSRHYDLVDEPNELVGRPLPDDDPLAERLLRLVAEDPDPSGIPAQLEQGIRLTAPKVSPNATDEDLERLRKLGYAGGR